MTDGVNSVQSSNNLSTILAVDSAQDKLEGRSQKKIVEELLKESTSFSNDSKAKAEQAREYLSAADSLEKMADAVRVKAEQLRKNEIKKEEAVKEVVEVVGKELEVPIPKNATPELLEQIADSLEARAKEHRQMADDLLKQSEESKRMANQLEEQAKILIKKDMNLSDLELKSAQAHTEGLNLVFKKLGIYKLDAEYKEQVAYAHKKKAEQLERGI